MKNDEPSDDQNDLSDYINQELATKMVVASGNVGNSCQN